MNGAVEHLDADDVVAIAVALFGDPPPIRDYGLLGSAAARPQTTVFGEDAYPSIWEKAAALLDSIVNNHALVDGNKRLGWLVTYTFLEINGVPIARAGNDAVYALVMRVASSRIAIADLAEELRGLTRR